MATSECGQRVRVARRVLFLVLVAGITSCMDRDLLGPRVVPPAADPASGALADSGAQATISQSSGVLFVAATFSESNGSSIAVSSPSGMQPGDVMVAQVVTQGSQRVSAAPAGWTAIRADYNGTHSNSYLYWKRAVESEPSAYTWSTNGGTRITAGITAYRNVILTGNPIETHSGQHNSGTNIVAPSISINTAGAHLVGAFSAASDAKETTLSFTPPSGMTEHYDGSSQMKGNQRNVVAMQSSAPLPGTGATGTRTAVLSASRTGWGQLIALRPAPSVASVVVTPATHTFTAVGQTQQFTAVAYDDAGNPVPGVTVTWSSTAAGVVTVDAAGLATAHATGEAQVRAQVGAVVGSASVTVAPAEVASITVTPASHTFTAVGQTQQFTAFVHDSNGNPVTGVAVTWSSTAAGVVSVDSVGLATAQASGTAEVRARVGEVVGTATVAVTIAGPSPVSWIWSGGQTATGAMVKTRLSSASTQVRLRISTDSLFGSFVETAQVGTAGNDVATFVISNLAPNTRYHYRPVVAGVQDPAKQGAFRTLPFPGSSHSFSFTMGACQRTESNKAVFDHVRQTNALFWLHAGDIHYSDIAVNNIDLYRAAFNTVHAQSRQAALYRAMPIVYMWDDHDGGGGNDGDATGAGWPAARSAYRENVPHHVLAEGSSGAIYHSFVVGRVRFIVSDLRSERSPKAAPDNASKTMLGFTQKAHFKAELAAAKAANQFVAWVTSVPWIAATGAGQDHWGGYNTERQEIAAYIDSLGIGGQMFALSGDMHASSIDSGENNAWGGFPLFHAAPIDQDASTKGGPYSHGPWTNGIAGEQFGLITVTDNGGAWINVTFSARRNGSQIPGGSYQFTRTLSGAEPPPITHVVVDPSSHTFASHGVSQQFSATAYDANGNPVAAQFTWTSSASAIASVNVNGLVTSHANGTVWIRAQTGSVKDSAFVQVAAPVITSVTVSPSSHTFTAPGQTRLFTAAAADADDNPVPATFTWSSSNSGVVSVSSSGLATALSNGTAWVRARAGSAEDSAMVEVVAPGIASIDILPDGHTFTSVGQTRTFTATAYDAGGNPVPAQFVWSSSAPSVASVTSSGLATAVSLGSAWIRAIAGASADSVHVLVDLPFHHTDFGAYATGVRPSDWSSPYSSTSYTTEELEGATGGKVLRYTTPSGSDAGVLRALRWNTVGELEHVEIQTVARSTAGSVRNDGMGLLARGSGSGTSGTFYATRLDSDANDWVIRKYVNGTANTLARFKNPFPKGTWIHQKFRVEGNVLRAKVWQVGTPEPADWTIEAADGGTPLSGGFVGVFMQRRETTNEFDWVRVIPLQ